MCKRTLGRFQDHRSDLEEMVESESPRQESLGPQSEEGFLSDEVIYLREMSPEDADTHLAGEDNAQMRWLSGGVSTKESVLDWIARNAALWDAGGPVFNRGVVEKSTGELVGMVEANTDAEHIEGIGPGEANISYGLYAAARGKGYATRAVNLMTEFLSERGIGAAVIKVSRANTKSIRVPKRCGFEQSGSLIAKDGEELVVFRKRLSQA